VLKHDFVLVDDKETEKLRDENAVECHEEVGQEGQVVESFAGS